MSTHWNQYWKNNFHGSFGEQDPLWYQQKIIPIWNEVFSTLPDGSKILDVATGNGAVTRLATRQMEIASRHWHIEAVDCASTQSLPGVRLFTPCSIEKLSLEAETYDLITSQFGLEYSSVHLSLPNLVTGLMPQGSIAIVAHHKESVLSNNSRDEIKQYSQCLQQKGILSRLRKLVIKMGEIRTPQDLQSIKNRASSARESLNQSVSRLTSQFPQGIVIAELLKNIETLFSSGIFWPVSSKLEYIDNLQQQMTLSRHRLTDQVSAAINEIDIDKWLVTASKNKLSLFRKKVITSDDSHILAWYLHFIKD